MSRSLQIKQEFNILDDMGIPVRECGIQVYITENQGKDQLVSLFNKVSAGMGEFLKETATQREKEKAQQENPFTDEFNMFTGQDRKGWF